MTKPRAPKKKETVLVDQGANQSYIEGGTVRTGGFKKGEEKCSLQRKAGPRLNAGNITDKPRK